MRSQFLRIVVASVAVAGFGMAAKAQSFDQIQFNTPHEFVVGGRTFPAGTYRVKRVNITDPKLLFLSSVETRETAMIQSTWVEGNSTDQNEVGFVQVGDERFLNKIETPNHIFGIAVSRSEILNAVAKSQSGSSTAGSAGESK
jgi:hypothetical protein